MGDIVDEEVESDYSDDLFAFRTDAPTLNSSSNAHSSMAVSMDGWDHNDDYSDVPEDAAEETEEPPAKRKKESTHRLSKYKGSLNDSRASDDDGAEDAMGRPIDPDGTFSVPRSAAVPLGSLSAYDDDTYHVVERTSIRSKATGGGLLQVDYKRNRPRDLTELSMSMRGQPHCMAFMLEPQVNGKEVVFDPSECAKDGEGNYGSPYRQDTMIPSLDQKPKIPADIHTKSQIQATVGYQKHELLRQHNEGCVLEEGMWCRVFDQGQPWVGQLYKKVKDKDGVEQYYFSFVHGSTNWSKEPFIRSDIEKWIPPPKYELHRTHRLNSRVGFTMIGIVKQFSLVQTTCGKIGIVVFNDRDRYVMDVDFGDGLPVTVCYLAIANIDPAAQPISSDFTSSDDDSPSRKRGLKATRRQTKRSGSRNGARAASSGRASSAASSSNASTPTSSASKSCSTNNVGGVHFSKQDVRQIVRDTVAEFRGSGAVDENALKELDVKADKRAKEILRDVKGSLEKEIERKVPLAVRTLDTAAITKLVDADFGKQIEQLQRSLDSLPDVTAVVQQEVDKCVKQAVDKVTTSHGNRLSQLENRLGNETVKNLLDAIVDSPTIVDVLRILGSTETDSQLIEDLKMSAKVSKFEQMSQEMDTRTVVIDEHIGCNEDEVEQQQSQSGPGGGGHSFENESMQLQLQLNISPIKTSGPGVQDGNKRSYPTSSTPADQMKKKQNKCSSRASTPYPHPPSPSEIMARQEREMLQRAQRQKDDVKMSKQVDRKKDYYEYIEQKGLPNRKVHFSCGGRNAIVTSELDKLLAQSAKLVEQGRKGEMDNKKQKGVLKLDHVPEADANLLLACFQKCQEFGGTITTSGGVGAVDLPWTDKTKGCVAHIASFDREPHVDAVTLLKCAEKARVANTDRLSTFCRMLSQELVPKGMAVPIHWTTVPSKPPRSPALMSDLYMDQRAPWNYMFKAALSAFQMVNELGEGDKEMASAMIRGGVDAMQRYESTFRRNHSIAIREFLSEK